MIVIYKCIKGFLRYLNIGYNGARRNVVIEGIYIGMVLKIMRTEVKLVCYIVDVFNRINNILG